MGWEREKKSLTIADFLETFAPAWLLNHCDVNNGDQFGMSTPLFLGEAWCDQVRNRDLWKGAVHVINITLSLEPGRGHGR